MTIAHLLEDFAIPFDGSQIFTLSEDALEDQRLASFEQGYSAGWDDAVKARDQETGQISANLASNLEDLSFTYNEALTQMTDCLTPFFRGLADVVLPETMALSFGHHIAEEMAKMGRDQAEQPVFVVVSPNDKAVVQSVLSEQAGMNARIEGDPLLGAGQAYVRIGNREREINCDSLVTSIRQSIDTFLYQNQEDLKHG
ncbi:ABC transporter ATP-binding protein [Aliisedimentitalea scapharcae]|uniref:ABC transporter ATP-binding protein n=1 Tax=Aliisedimentitalea scapharcae TaxID=1524259 RepID=A0ABZ2XSR2_9RHOB|nr:ABC transporter ATP-binding protein [Rhodobacteraceae bacterium M382]